MKVMVMVDLEGATGLDDTRAMTPDYPELYAGARQEITRDVNAAIRGLRRAGATDIVVADGHMARARPDLFNVIPDQMEPGVELVRGAAALEEPRGLQAVIMVGMHCRNGTPIGFMGHTTSGFTAVKFNGEWYGEVEMLAAVAGELGAPTIMVSGDDATIRQAKHYMPWIEGAVVKTATGRNTCTLMPGAETRPRIEAAAERALRSLDRMRLLVVPPPVTTELFFPSAAHADKAACIPRAVRSSETSLTYISDSYLEARRFFTTGLRLASAVGQEEMMRYLTSDPGCAARRLEHARQNSLDFWNRPPWLTVELPPA